LVTDLYNYAAPYLRHDLGNLGRLAPTACGCGRSLPLLDVVGRAP
jgi:phenylacetate-coenzyme A ligase PaaK-like adenylate-forming protein